MLHPVLEDAIESLLTAWRHYDIVSRQGAGFATRSAARRSLDVHRIRVHRLRRGLHPEARELEEVAFGTHCPSLDAPVFIWAGDAVGDGSFLCSCGAMVEVAGADRAAG